MGYVLARIRELKAELAAMPEVDPAVREVNKQEAIRELAPVIASLQKKGYSLDQVVALLAARANIPITVGTLKTYLSRLKGSRRPRGPTGDSPSTPERRARTPRASSAETPPSTPGQPPDNTAVGTGSGPPLKRAEAAEAPVEAAANAAATCSEYRDTQRPAPPAIPELPRDNAAATAAMTGGLPAEPSTPDGSVGRQKSAAAAPSAGNGNPGSESSTTEQEPQGKQPQAPPRSSKQASFTAREDTEEI